MKIQNFLVTDNDGKPQLLDFEKLIQKHCRQYADVGLSDKFQVLYDTQMSAIWRFNDQIGINDDYVGQFWIIDLNERTIETGVDCSTPGRARSYKSRKLNCLPTHIFKIVSIQ